MKNLLIILIFLLVAVILILTRPDKEQHKEAMMKAIEEYVDEEARVRLGDNALAKIGRGIVVKTAETALNSKLRENNYFVFNTTSVHLKGKDNTLSVGILRARDRQAECQGTEAAAERTAQTREGTCQGAEAS